MTLAYHFHRSMFVTVSMKVKVDMKKKLKLSLSLLCAMSFVSLSGFAQEQMHEPQIPVLVPPPVAGCLPVNQPINITATNVYFDKVKILAGNIPEGQASGTVVLGGPEAISKKDNGTIAIDRTSVDGTIHLIVTPVCKDGSCKQANMTGTITISTITLQDILNKFGGTIDGAQSSQPCISGVAIDGGVYNNILYGAKIYLYVNNSQHGYTIYAKASNKDKRDRSDLIQVAELPEIMRSSAATSAL